MRSIFSQDELEGLFSSRHGCHRDFPVQGRQLSLIMDSQSEQIYVRDLGVGEDDFSSHHIQDADLLTPKNMTFC
jgi:hypothetical protein